MSDLMDLLEAHVIEIPGLDHEKCSICGYIPTSFHVKYLEKVIRRENAKERPSRKLIDEINAQIAKANKIIAKHSI